MNERVIIHRRVNAIETLKCPHGMRKLITITFIRVLVTWLLPIRIDKIDRSKININGESMKNREIVGYIYSENGEK